MGFLNGIFEWNFWVEFLSWKNRVIFWELKGSSSAGDLMVWNHEFELIYCSLSGNFIFHYVSQTDDTNIYTNSSYFLLFNSIGGPPRCFFSGWTFCRIFWVNFFGGWTFWWIFVGDLFWVEFLENVLTSSSQKIVPEIVQESVWPSSLRLRLRLQLAPDDLINWSCHASFPVYHPTR